MAEKGTYRRAYLLSDEELELVQTALNELIGPPPEAVALQEYLRMQHAQVVAHGEVILSEQANDTGEYDAIDAAEGGDGRVFK